MNQQWGNVESYMNGLCKQAAIDPHDLPHPLHGEFPPIKSQRLTIVKTCKTHDNKSNACIQSLDAP